MEPSLKIDELFSPTRLNRISTVLSRYVESEKIAGIVALVACQEKTVYLKAFGLQDRDLNIPMKLDTVFRIYSMTKPITSAAVLTLMEEGLIRLSDPISAYIPDFKDPQVLSHLGGSTFELIPAKRGITIKDLLTHSSGLCYGFDEHSYIDLLYKRQIWAKFEKELYNLESFVKDIAQLPLAFHPGTAYRYSLATDVLGYLVQVVSGKKFGDYLQERFFDPLEMSDTGFMVPPEKVDRFSTVYGPGESGGMKTVDVCSESRYLKPPQFDAGGMGLVSTALDYFKFAQMLLNQGELKGRRYLSRKTVELMTTNHFPPGLHPWDDPSIGMGLGVSVLLEPGRSAGLGSRGNYGWGGAANTNFWVDPVEKMIGIIMLQYMPSDTFPIVADFRNMAYQALL
jgi:CubicO group peptidase (beta-lactamase class C family)